MASSAISLRLIQGLAAFRVTGDGWPRDMPEASYISDHLPGLVCAQIVRWHFRARNPAADHFVQRSVIGCVPEFGFDQVGSASAAAVGSMAVGAMNLEEPLAVFQIFGSRGRLFRDVWLRFDSFLTKCEDASKR